MLAARGGFIETITVLVKNGVLVDTQNTREQTALHICALTNQTNTALFLIRLGIH
jgi:ankyrin repeat protein